MSETDVIAQLRRSLVDNGVSEASAIGLGASVCSVMGERYRMRIDARLAKWPEALRSTVAAFEVNQHRQAGEIEHVVIEDWCRRAFRKKAEADGLILPKDEEW